MWLPACWAFLFTVSTPANVLVLDPIAHPERMGARITSICPFVRWSFRMWDLPRCGWHACIVNHWRSMTSVWNIDTLCIPIPVALPRGGLSSLYIDALYMRERVFVCCTSLGAVARHAPGDVGVRERLPGSAAINTNWCICACGFRAWPFARSARVDFQRYFMIFLIIIDRRINLKNCVKFPSLNHLKYSQKWM